MARTKEGHNSARQAVVPVGNRSQNLSLADMPFVNNPVHPEDLGTRRPPEDFPERLAVQGRFESDSSQMISRDALNSTVHTDHQVTLGASLPGEPFDSKVSMIEPSSASMGAPTSIACPADVITRSEPSCAQEAAENAPGSDDMTVTSSCPEDIMRTDPECDCLVGQHGNLKSTDKSSVSQKSATPMKRAADNALKSVGCQVEEGLWQKTFNAELEHKISAILSSDIGPESKLKFVLETLFGSRHVFAKQTGQNDFRLALESEGLCMNHFNELKKDDTSSGSISLTGDTPLRRSEQSFEESNEPTLLQTLYISANIQNRPMDFHLSADDVVPETKQDQETPQQEVPDLPDLCSPVLLKQTCGKDLADDENEDARSDSEKNVNNPANPSCDSKAKSPQEDGLAVRGIDSEVPLIEGERMDMSADGEQNHESTRAGRTDDDQRYQAQGSTAVDGRKVHPEVLSICERKSHAKSDVDTKLAKTVIEEKKKPISDSFDEHNLFDIEDWDEDALREMAVRIENIDTTSLDHVMENAVQATEANGSELDLQQSDKAILNPIAPGSAELVSIDDIDDLSPVKVHSPLTTQITEESGHECDTKLPLPTAFGSAAVTDNAITNDLFTDSVARNDKIRNQTSLASRDEQGEASDGDESLQITEDQEEVLDGEILDTGEYQVVQTKPRLVSDKSDPHSNNNNEQPVQADPNWKMGESDVDDDSADVGDEIMDYEILVNRNHDIVGESGRLDVSTNSRAHDSTPNDQDSQDGSFVLQTQNDAVPEDEEEEIIDGEILDESGHPIAASCLETHSVDNHPHDELREHDGQQADARTLKSNGSDGEEDEVTNVKVLDGLSSAGVASAFPTNGQHPTPAVGANLEKVTGNSAIIPLANAMPSELKNDQLSDAFAIKSVPMSEPLREIDAIDFGDSDDNSDGDAVNNGTLVGKRPLSAVYSSQVPNPYLGELLNSQCGNENEASEQPPSDACLANRSSVAGPRGGLPPFRETVMASAIRANELSTGGPSPVAGPQGRPLPRYVPRHIPHGIPQHEPQIPSAAVSSSTDELYQTPPRKRARQPVSINNQRSMDASGSLKAVPATSSDESDVQLVAVVPGRNTTPGQSSRASPRQPTRHRSVIRANRRGRPRSRNPTRKRGNSNKDTGEMVFTLIDTIDLTQDAENGIEDEADPGAVGEVVDEDDVSDSICSKCHEVGHLIVCEGICNRAWHHECIGFREVPEGEFRCSECSSGAHHCSVCDGTYRTVKCGHPDCGRFFHPSCVRFLPTVQNVGGSFICPLHHCGCCLNETDFRRDTRCVVCTVSYHSDCLPPGCIEKHDRHFVCPRHKTGRKSSFSTDGTCCSCHESSGKVLNCSGCAGSWHLDCLPMRSLLFLDSLPERNRSAWTCVACLRGDYPLPGDVVWAGLKAKSGLLWPAVVMHPESNEGKIRVETICENKAMIIDNHRILFWNYRDPKKELESKTKSLVLRKAIEIGEVDYDNNVSTSSGNIRYGLAELSDSAFKRISSLRDPGGLAKVTSREPKTCSCHISKMFCSTDDCPNVAAGVECHRSCPSKKSCMNQKFQRKQYGTHIKVDYSFLFQDYVMKAKTFIPKGTLILEVCGIVLSEAEAEGRLSEATSSSRFKPYPSLYMYLLRPSTSETQEQALYIDLATECNLARFFWHSCDPNCHTETLVADGSLRMGIYASYDINVNERLSTLCSFPDPDHRTCFKNAIVVGCMCDNRECTHANHVLSRYQVQPNSFNDQGPR